ncbi:MAG: UDP-N-acetylmuramate dehydrogenase [Chlorobium sp.]|nr:UDP-N-acetylmuramate dehydrogenase [Chlorobium sp.]
MVPITARCHCFRDFPISEKAYYGIGGGVRFFCMPSSAAELADIVSWTRTKGMPLAMLGLGSNMLFSDAAFPGVVLSTERMQQFRQVSELEFFFEAGVMNTAVAETIQRHGIAGADWLYRLPGRIGGTVRMNSRCFGGEISSIASAVQVLTLDGSLVMRCPEEVFLGYKHTSLMHTGEIVTGVMLRFPGKADPDAIREEMLAHEAERLRKRHFDFPSCGSTFKNNHECGKPSGMIFEELGFSGAREGGAVVGEHHANFIFNTGNATADDVLRLAGKMRAAALRDTGVKLELEVECTGLFPRELLDACGSPYRVDRDDPSKGWSGLLLYPNGVSGADEGVAAFPRLLLEGALASSATVAVRQLRPLCEARMNPEQPFLSWSTEVKPGESVFVPAPKAAPGDFLDKLWEFGVSELFIGNGKDDGPYLEFEMTPAGQWVALAFDAPRHRTAGYEVLSAERWVDGVWLESLDGSFGMSFSLGLLEKFFGGIRDGILSLQCASSVEGGLRDLFPSWHDAPVPADFHRPERFFRITLS